MPRISVSDYGKAAKILEEGAACSPEPWHMEKDGSDVYVQGPEYGQWFAYTGNDAGAESFAQWMALLDPETGRLLADVLRRAYSPNESLLYESLDALVSNILNKAAQ